MAKVLSTQDTFEAKAEKHYVTLTVETMGEEWIFTLDPEAARTLAAQLTDSADDAETFEDA